MSIPRERPKPKQMQTPAINQIADERSRQQAVEGYDIIHDDQHDMGEMAIAAACYALPEDVRSPKAESEGPISVSIHLRAFLWPWQESDWRPTRNDRIRELVKAGALIVAEIERLQREEYKL